MVKVVIESDKPINVSVKRSDDGAVKLLRDIEEVDGDEDNEKNACINAPK